ncbi:MAG: GTP-binding protein, partial [Deltaproteobacteria bacterium]|nr:GTP-binding protein [Deltaproteobacteria bacterium]
MSASDEKRPPAFVIGTAGHIDHGKTTLVKALTGIDTDRLKEEKERGVTTELGFAHLELGDGRIASIIDAPGHERFVRHMIAGAGGLDLAVLVVAADEGVMPQTREHLDILGLIGVKQGLVVLTKCDLVESEDLELALDDLREGLAGSFMEGAPIMRFSASLTDTHPGFREDFIAYLRGVFPRTPARPIDRPLKIAIDRVFVIKGFG